MRKLKMFGFTLMAMLVGIVSTSALELGTSISTDGKLSYTKSADETFAYQVIRITQEEWNTVSNDVQTSLKLLEDSTKQLERDYNSYVNAVNIYNDSVKAYEDNPTDENKTIMDMAEADMNASKSYIMQTLEILKTNMTSTMNFIQKVAPYTVDSMTKVEGSETTGEITIDMTDASEDDVFIVWLQSDEYSEFSKDNVLIGDVYTKDGALTPVIPDDVEVPTVNPSTPDVSKEEIKNPKTGVSMPVALGFSVIALAGAVMFIVCRKQLFKQL